VTCFCLLFIFDCLGVIGLAGQHYQKLVLEHFFALYYILLCISCCVIFRDNTM